MLETIIHNIQANSSIAYYAVLVMGLACMVCSLTVMASLAYLCRKETKPYQLPFNPDPRTLDRNWGIIKLRPSKE